MLCREGTKRPSLGKGYVEDDVKKSLEPVMVKYDRVGASKYAKEVCSPQRWFRISLSWFGV